MINRPSKKQKELLDFIDAAIKASGYAPSYREIMRALDYKSVSTVATHINGLIQKGYVVKKDRSARSLGVVTKEEAAEKKTSVQQKLTWLRAEADKEYGQPGDKKILHEAGVIIAKRYDFS